MAPFWPYVHRCNPRCAYFVRLPFTLFNSRQAPRRSARASYPCTRHREPPKAVRQGDTAYGIGPAKLTKRRTGRSRGRGWLGNGRSTPSARPYAYTAAPGGLPGGFDLVASPPERLGLPTREAPPVQIAEAVGVAFRRHDAVAVDAPAAPLRPQRPEIAQAIQAQQLDHDPRHPVLAAIPRSHGPRRAAEKAGAALPTQQARVAELAEVVRRDPPRLPVGQTMPGPA